MLAAMMSGPVLAQTTTPTTGTPQNVLHLSGTLADATMCADQLTGEKVTGVNLGYPGTAEFSNLAYPIVVGDYLEYEVMVPKASTLHGGAVDGDLSAKPRAAGGATIRDSYVTQDQNGLFAHPATDYDVLASRFIPEVANRQTRSVPLWASDQWYKRDIDLSKLAIDASGNPIMLNDLFLVVDQHDSTHLNDLCPVDKTNANFSFMVRNINIKNHDATGKEVIKKAIFNGEAKLPDGKTSEDMTGTGAKGTVSIVEYTPVTNDIAPGSNTNVPPTTATNPVAGP
jgi:hypothetical protein